MPFLRSFSINATRQQPFPYNVPAVRFAKDIALDKQITILVGDNGSGKSTLLESIALHLDLPLMGGDIGMREGFEAARTLQPYLSIQQVRKPLQGFFFRAEDFSDFIYSLKRQRDRNNMYLEPLRGEVADAVINELNDGMNMALREMRRDYGENLLAFSHGEAYLKIIEEKISDNGIYLLDEPEAALSPQKQLALISYILEMVKRRNTQFIIATHSPILMGIPEAQLYEIQEEGIQPVEYQETEHYRITHSFLSNPGSYLRYL
ncbi:AAA family ATPase [Chitinophaga flava]|uniref:ATPase n=1 Tax=Chitinophaga flava TaxID=2259036 RepID=A0A365XWI3_9BACT|nr:AAA family ATPase [Chitinophaga flava]RBL89945.1 ATPase [Chitinophaga flava]